MHKIRLSENLPWDIISYPTQVKIKIKNSHVSDVHWLYRMSHAPSLRSMSLKVFDVTKCHGNVIKQMSEIQVITLLTRAVSRQHSSSGIGVILEFQVAL